MIQEHIFSNSNIDLDNKFLDEGSIFKVRKISNDNYAAIYNLEGTSPIISDTSTLNLVLNFLVRKMIFTLIFQQKFMKK